MIGLEVSVFFLLYLGVGGALILGLACYYDRLDFQRTAHQRNKVVFHCIRCGHIYVAASQAPECACPACGLKNGRLSF